MINETWLGKKYAINNFIDKKLWSKYSINVTDILMFDIKTNNFFFRINSIKKMYEVAKVDAS